MSKESSELYKKWKSWYYKVNYKDLGKRDFSFGTGPYWEDFPVEQFHLYD